MPGETIPAMTRTNFLVTGPPGCGKTTLVRDIAAKLGNLRPSGFYTAEIRAGGIRRGFALVGFDGTKGLLAHVDIKGPSRVGKYGVDIPAFEEFLGGLYLPRSPPGLVIIDEIGKMECMSGKFREIILDVLSSGVFCIATIALKGDRFIGAIREREDCELLFLTQKDRDEIAGILCDRIRMLL